MSQKSREHLLLVRYRPWLVSHRVSAVQESYKPFFEQGVVVLDANVLLDLYRYTQGPRNQVLAALKLIARKERLWLPHQVALEFARNRPKAVEGRLGRLRAVSRTVEERFSSAVRAVTEARNEVAKLLRDMAHEDTTANNLIAGIDEAAISAALRSWRNELKGHLDRLRNAENLTPQHVMEANEPLLREIAELFGANIGDPPGGEKLECLIRHAISYRYPNRIPPGYADQDKDTDLKKAGDYLLWEEIIQYASRLPEPRRVLLVSRDQKEDWYEQDGRGQPLRPWPALHDEMQERAGADLLILTPKDFLQGAGRFLGAQLEENTYKEIERVSKDADEESPSTEPINPELPLVGFSSPTAYTLRGMDDVPQSAGVHIVLLEDDVIFVGATGNLRARLRHHLYGPRGSSVLHDRVGRMLDTPEHTASTEDIKEWLNQCSVRWYRTEQIARDKAILIDVFDPMFNK